MSGQKTSSSLATVPDIVRPPLHHIVEQLYQKSFLVDQCIHKSTKITTQKMMVQIHSPVMISPVSASNPYERLWEQQTSHPVSSLHLHSTICEHPYSKCQMPSKTFRLLREIPQK